MSPPRHPHKEEFFVELIFSVPASFASFFLLSLSYFAGKCFPVGDFEQGFLVKLVKEEYLEPQYLQVY